MRHRPAGSGQLRTDIDNGEANPYDPTSIFEGRKETPVLDLMRRHAKSWFIKVALGAIILIFIFWFGWSGPGERSQNYAAKVNDAVIPTDQFQMLYESELEQIRQRFKGSLPPGLLEKLNLKKNLVEALVNRLLLFQEGQRLGLFVTDADLTRDVRSNPLFQRNGLFDESIYRTYLQAIKMPVSAYEQSRKQQLLEEQIMHLLTDAVKTDPEEIKRFWHFQNDKLVLSMLVVRPSEEREAADPKAAEAYFRKNEAKYEIPASVDVQYVSVSRRDVAKQISVPEADVRSYYQNNPKEFVSPERVKARHILLKVPPDAEPTRADEVLKKAEGLLARIKGGEDFEKLAASESEDEANSAKGGDFGFFARGTMNPALERVAFTLEPGGTSAPIRTDQGYHLLRVDETKPEAQLEFDTVKEKIEEKLREEMARKKLDTDTEAFYEEVYRTEDLEGPAKKFGFPVQEAKSILKGSGLPEAGDDPKVVEELFQLRTGEISRLHRGGDRFSVLKVVERYKARQPDFDEVRSTVERDFLKEQAVKDATKKAEEIVEELKKNPGSEDQVAQKSGLTWRKLDPISRTAGFLPSLGSSPEVNEMLTSVTPAAPVYPLPVKATEGVAVLRLLDVERATDQQYARDAETFERWVLEVRKTEFLKGWLRVLEQRSKVSINEKL
jgi:peptidyl-prolyl cis-trans isomerase D